MTRANVIFTLTLSEAFDKAGIPFPDPGPQPGQLCRFSTNGRPGDTAGWCRVFPDGVGAVFGCHRDDSSFTWQHRRDDGHLPSPEEQLAFKARAEQAHRQAAAEREEQYTRAAVVAADSFAKCTDLEPTHPYVLKKGITPFGARQDADGSVVLPVHDGSGTLQSLQFIKPDGGKRFLYQAKMKGGRLILGTPENGQPVVLVEGWATGCSVHEATGKMVVVCFSGANLAHVAAGLRQQLPASPLLIAGDLDAHGKGSEYAQAAASAGAPASVIFPRFSDARIKGDFNDLHQAENLEAVRQQIEASLQTGCRTLSAFPVPDLPQCDARDGTADTRALSEVGNAYRLLDAHGQQLQYVYDAQSWLAWKDWSWQWDDGSGVRMLAAQLPAKIYSEGGRHLDDAEAFGKWARKSQELRTIQSAVSLLRDFPAMRLPLACIDADQYVVGFDHARQVLDLQRGTVRTAIPSDYVTKSLGITAVGNAGMAVRWMQFLDQVFDGDQELIGWMQRFCGYLLTGSTREQIFLFCFGHGANGKSVFIEVLKYILGDYSRAIASETLSESKRQAGAATPDLAALIGARLVLCSETEDNTAMAESLVKSLVAGDSMSVRKLYAAPVQFTPHFKLVMAGNHKPIVKGNDHGIWRRVRLVPFNRTFAPQERDPHLLEKLKAEAAHILAWMVQGCLDWQQHDLSNTPKAIRQATDAYQVDQDVIGTWLGECTRESELGETLCGDLYANYKAWCQDNGLRPASAIALGRRLGERGYAQRRSNGKRFWLGLTLGDLPKGDYARATRGY